MPQRPGKRSGWWRPQASGPRLGTAALAVAGVLAGVLAAANDALHGGRYLALVALGTVAALLLVEAAHRDGRARATLALVGVCGGAAVLAAAVASPPSEEPPAAQARGVAPAPQKPAAPPLRIAIEPQDPGIFQVALPTAIDTPPDGVGWRELIDQGAIDVSQSVLAVTLANRSDRPLTIRDVHVEVVGSDPPPRAAVAFQFTQGDAGLRRLTAELTSGRPGSVAALFDTDAWLTARSEGTADPPPFFADHYVSLLPGEIYEASVTVKTDVEQAISYRLVVSGSTPDGALHVVGPPVQRISGLSGVAADGVYEHYLVRGYLEYLRAGIRCESVAAHDWYATDTLRSLNGRCPS